mmetsp:Transcript_87366/g.164701  ORF Transcript_87366/g.164701 Transcript_87366/m.164701 type:complete len:327 (+) Transcript_87366:178-1158(+)
MLSLYKARIWATFSYCSSSSASYLVANCSPPMERNQLPISSTCASPFSFAGADSTLAETSCTAGGLLPAAKAEPPRTCCALISSMETSSNPGGRTSLELSWFCSQSNGGSLFKLHLGSSKIPSGSARAAGLLPAPLDDEALLAEFACAVAAIVGNPCWYVEPRTSRLLLLFLMPSLFSVLLVTGVVNGWVGAGIVHKALSSSWATSNLFSPEREGALACLCEEAALRVGGGGGGGGTGTGGAALAGPTGGTGGTVGNPLVGCVFGERFVAEGCGSGFATTLYARLSSSSSAGPGSKNDMTSLSLSSVAALGTSSCPLTHVPFDDVS